MPPKVEAALKFAESRTGRTALITLLEKANDAINGKTGTTISFQAKLVDLSNLSKYSDFQPPLFVIFFAISFF